MQHTIILLLAIVTGFSAYSQTYIQVGDSCFDIGDYECSEEKYKEAFQFSSGKEKQIAEIKVTRTKWCKDHIEAADRAFKNANFNLAIENYESVLESNPKDEHARNQIAKCKLILFPYLIKLELSHENMSFPSSGGIDSVRVTTNVDSYSIDYLPFWCSVQVHSDYFILKCIENLYTISRADYVIVLAGKKTVKLYVSQLGSLKPQIGSLRVAKENLIFSSQGGISESINVFSYTGSYSISHAPGWINVNEGSNNFSVSCKANKRKKIRSGWFILTDGYNELRIAVSQDGN